MVPKHLAPTQPSTATVLVVEDEIFVREPIAEYLRECGYQVLEAADAREAILLIDSVGSVDVVFSDVRMPGDMDGIALAQWLRTHHPEVSVLLTSGYFAARNGAGGAQRQNPGTVRFGDGAVHGRLIA